MSYTNEQVSTFRNLQDMFHHIPERVNEERACGDTIAAGWLKPEDLELNEASQVSSDNAPAPSKSPFSQLLPQCVRQELAAMSSTALKQAPPAAVAPRLSATGPDCSNASGLMAS